MMGLITLGMVAVQMPRMVQGWREAPDARQRIAALLVSWGCRPPGLTLPVEDAEIAPRIEALKSPDGEERVRAARWLAEHGVRDAVPRIAAAMWSPGTGRPCQLAHSLGGLGDAGVVDDLLSGARQTANTDLRVCSLIGLRHLASEQSVEGLLALCDDPFAARLSVQALGEIADARALPQLRRFSQSDDPSLQRAAALAIARIELVESDDPVPLVAARLRESADDGRLDLWAVRWLARAGDERAVAPLAATMRVPGRRRRGGLSRDDREALAAALLAHGEPGIAALREIAASAAEHRGVSGAAGAGGAVGAAGAAGAVGAVGAALELNNPARGSAPR